MDNYQIVLRIVELGSFSAAAKSLSLSQSTVSRRIEAIEREIGTALFIRKGRTFRLTPTGRFFYEKSKEVSTITRQAKRDILEYTGRRLKTISISAHESFGFYVLPKLLREFHKYHPEVRFELALQSNTQISLNKNYDFYLQDGKLKSSSMKAKRVGRVDVNVYASPSFIRNYGIKPGRVDRWDHLPYCMLDAYYVVPLQKKVLPESKLKGDQHAIHANDLSTLIRCAEEGFGIIFLADYIAKPSVDAGALIKINRGDCIYNSVLYLLYSADLPLSPIASEFKLYFAKKLADLLETDKWRTQPAHRSAP